jgi:hypothetical protein
MVENVYRVNVSTYFWFVNVYYDTMNIEWTSRSGSSILRPKKKVLHHPPVYPFPSSTFGMIIFANSHFWAG